MTAQKSPRFPPVEILTWQVERRASVQHLMVDLYGILCRSRSEIVSNNDINRAFHLMVACSFSLWRAVFLTHVARTPEAVMTHCEEFLGTVIRDNAINFPQDRDTREWTVGYYLNNANLRLQKLAQLSMFAKNNSLSDFVRTATDGIVWDNALERWDEMFRILQSLFVSLREQVINTPT